ncbi:peptide chain release factor N(5)-glutamine methyltransferase [soil metagenome]
MMTVNELYRYFRDELGKLYEKNEAELICSILFEHVGIGRAELIKDSSHIPGKEITGRLDKYLLALKDYTPIQYVTGEAWFYKMKLKVSPAVLIPRPETEELAEAVINYLKNKPAVSVLDIGTGSGCISIAIKKNVPAATITAIDISSAAIAIAKENASIQQTTIDFKQNDFLDEQTWESFASFDVIVSNPPYIPENEKQLLDKNVTAFEPHSALFVANERPLIFYEKIAAFGKTHLKKDGKIFMETHEEFAAQTAALFNNAFYTAIVLNDLQGKQRMVIATIRSQ